jgi:GNAT superfamily N-acetyltransferase
VLAVYEDHRGKGYGKRLLAAADQLAADRGSKGLSIIVADNNSTARKLYEMSGYKLVEQKPMVKDSWVSEGQNWLLFLKQPG